MTHSRNDLAAAREQAERVGPRLVERAEEAIRAFDGTRYLRHSMAAPLLPKIQRVCRDCRSLLVRRQLNDRSLAALGALEETGATKKRFELSRDAANERFVASQKTRVLRAAKGVTKPEPTDEQAAAIATDEDVTLVLAGAGTGKTAVITTKVAHLVRNQGAKPGAPRCSACGKGYLVGDNGIAACTGAHCDEWARLCPRCDIGVLILRNGPYSWFLACSAFTSNPPCEYTERVSTP